MSLTSVFELQHLKYQYDLLSRDGSYFFSGPYTLWLALTLSIYSPVNGLACSIYSRCFRAPQTGEERIGSDTFYSASHEMR